MSEAHIAVLNSILEEANKLSPEIDNPAEYFEYFAAKHILRDYAIDDDEIRFGLVGQSLSDDKVQRSSYARASDGGIDGFYLFLNGVLVRDIEQAEDAKHHKRNIKVDVVLIQATTERGFRIDKILRLKEASENIFSVERNPEQFTEHYSEGLLDAIDRFRTVYRHVCNKFPVIEVSYFYVSKGVAPDETEDTDVNRKKRACEADTRKVLPTIGSCSFNLLGAAQLCDLASKPPKSRYDLKCLDSMQERGSWVSLVSLSEYYRFITDDAGMKREHLFDSNVRGYQGDVEVNEAIRKTLTKTGTLEDFWWLNNGVTIICNDIGGETRRAVIDDPQIVNGHQTSHEIHEHFSRNPKLLEEDKRSVVVRIIKVTDIETQDSIIRATNSQTAIPAAYLWSTDQIHRNIERLLRASGFYYDRRKNSWRTSSYPTEKVVGISELAQSVVSICLQEPDHARARPARYFKEAEYKRVFSDHMLDIYPLCAALKKRGERFLRTRQIDKRDRNNLIFYLLTAVVCIALRSPRPKTNTLKGLRAEQVSDNHFAEALDLIEPIYTRLGSSDKAAKGVDMVNELRRTLREKYGRSRGGASAEGTVG